MSESSTEERAWLVERLYSNQTYYLSIRYNSGVKGAKLGNHWYSTDVNDGVRFSRQSDAITVLYHLCSGEGRVAEHLWTDGTK